MVRQARNEDAGYTPEPHSVEDVKAQVSYIATVLAACNYVKKIAFDGDVSALSVKDTVDFVKNVSTITGVSPEVPARISNATQLVVDFEQQVKGQYEPVEVKIVNTASSFFSSENNVTENVESYSPSMGM